ncbi:MAG: hypothetical protein GVY19_11890 [Bacteroidetes bacterium]|jgi:predicted nucleotidyltransferase|nr:hypothetical protein [Bacteroidota bacterium]
MNYFQQFKSIINALNKADVDYMIIGGFAVNVHGYARNTGDLDIWVDNSKENMQKLYNSFVHLGFNKKKSEAAVNFLSKNHMIKIPLDNTKVEFMDSFIANNDFQESYKNHLIINPEGMPLKVIGFDDLLTIKQKSARMKDLLDVKQLKEIKRLKESDLSISDKTKKKNKN